MNKRVLILFLLQICFITSQASAYFENYPPYKFKDGPPAHLKAQSLVDLQGGQYKKDGIVVVLKDSDKGYYISITDGKRKIYERSAGFSYDLPRPQDVYTADLNGDGLKDFIVISWWGGAGLASHADRVELLLKKKDGSYATIQYESMAAGLEDFVDLDKDGRYEVIMTGIYGGPQHNYFSYRHFQIKDYKLIESKATKAFPKYVWMTNNPNDKDTKHLTLIERRMDRAAFQDGIVYS